MKKVLLFFTLILTMLFLVACSSSSNKEDTSLTSIQEKGFLTIGTSADYAPYEFHILQDGKDEIVGFEIEIAKEIAKDLGVELKIVDMSFDGLLTALNSGQVDMVIAGMTPTEQRAQAVDFSNVYYTAKQNILIRTEDLDKYNFIEDFMNKKIGVQRNSLQEMIFNEHFTLSNLVSLTKIPNIILELQNGTIDASIIEAPVAKGYITQYPELSISKVEIPEDNQEGDTGSAVAVRKGSSALLEQINATISRLEQEGAIDNFVLEATLLSEQQ